MPNRLAFLDNRHAPAALRPGILALNTQEFSSHNGSTPLKDLLENAVSLKLVSKPFSTKKHVLTKCGEHSVCLIDGAPFFGSDLDIPTTMLTELIAIIKGKQIKLNVSGMYNTWIVRGVFSDGATAYHAQWLISESGSVRTLLAGSEMFSNTCHTLLQ